MTPSPGLTPGATLCRSLTRARCSVSSEKPTKASRSGRVSSGIFDVNCDQPDPSAHADGTDCSFMVNLYPMKPRRLWLSLLTSLLLLSFIALAIPIGAQRPTQPAPRRTTTRSPRDEALWQRAIQIQRRAVVIDTHNDVTTPMTNDDYDLGGNPPTPYRTSIERMKKGGMTAEFFSLYIKPWYVAHGGAARRTLDMIDSVYRAVERHPN